MTTDSFSRVPTHLESCTKKKSWNEVIPTLLHKVVASEHVSSVRPRKLRGGATVLRPRALRDEADLVQHDEGPRAGALTALAQAVEERKADLRGPAGAETTRGAQKI